VHPKKLTGIVVEAKGKFEDFWWRNE